MTFSRTSLLACLVALGASSSPVTAQDVFPEPIVAPDKDTLTWVTLGDYQYVKGALTDVHEYPILAIGSLGAASQLDVSSDQPLPGKGFFYLLKPMGQWTAKQLAVFFEGTGDQQYVIQKRMRRPGGKSYRIRSETEWKGASAILEGWYAKSGGGRWTERIGEVMRPNTCPECDGERLNPLSRRVTLGRSATLGRISAMTVSGARA